MSEETIFYGVYRKFKNGKLKYVSRSATSNRKLAEEIAADLTRGEIVTPTGRIAQVTPHPHIAKPIRETE